MYIFRLKTGSVQVQLGIKKEKNAKQIEENKGEKTKAQKKRWAPLSGAELASWLGFFCLLVAHLGRPYGYLGSLIPIHGPWSWFRAPVLSK